MFRLVGRRLGGVLGDAAARGSARALATRAAIHRCSEGYSIEITPMAAKKVDSFASVEGLKPGTHVNVTFLVGADIDDTVSLVRRLYNAGMAPVAHVPARSFRDFACVEEYFVRLRDAGCQEVLVLGGGAPEPVGNLTEAMHILGSGLLQKYGFSRVGVAAHPEGHPDVAEEIMTAALLAKAEWASAEGIELYYETQFCFEAAPIIQWEQRVRGLLSERLGRKEDLPSVRLGVAGPAKYANLIKFALASGVGPSMRFVTKYAKNVLKLATTAAPDRVIRGIASHQEKEPACLVKGLHYYTFGGLKPTLRFANDCADGNFDLRDGGFTARCLA